MACAPRGHRLGLRGAGAGSSSRHACTARSREAESAPGGHRLQFKLKALLQSSLTHSLAHSLTHSLTLTPSCMGRAQLMDCSAGPRSLVGRARTLTETEREAPTHALHGERAGLAGPACARGETAGREDGREDAGPPVPFGRRRRCGAADALAPAGGALAAAAGALRLSGRVRRGPTSAPSPAVWRDRARRRRRGRGRGAVAAARQVAGAGQVAAACQDAAAAGQDAAAAAPGAAAAAGQRLVDR